MRATFLLRSLERGGAERQLAALCEGLHRRGHDIEVLTFYPGGPYAEQLAGNGVRVRSIGKGGRWDIRRFAHRLRRHLADRAPEVLHGYLTEPNVATLVARSLSPRPRVVWGVRASGAPAGTLDAPTRLARRMEFPLARLADLVIANSHAGRAHAIAGGAPAGRAIVVENGIDASRFRFDRRERDAARAAWRLAPGSKVVGIVSRFAPMKGYELFVDAAALAAADAPGLHFVCVGHGSPAYLRTLRERARAAGVADRISWLDGGEDAASLYSGFDLYTSTSAFGEGFSNSIAEAMACGLPCVVTDVGDAARILGPLGSVLDRPTPHRLARAWLAALEGDGTPPLAEHRARIEREFSTERLVERTERALSRVIRGEPAETGAD